MPSILILSLNITHDLTLIQKFGLIILIHSFIIIPLFYLWAKQRYWFSQTTGLSYNSWSHPRLFFNIALALIYPLLWGCYFSFIRYLCLGTELHFFTILDYFWSIETLIILLFILSGLFNIIVWFLLLWSVFIFFRTYLWNSFSIIMYALHLELIRFNCYVFFMEKIYKLHFLFSILSH